MALAEANTSLFRFFFRHNKHWNTTHKLLFVLVVKDTVVVSWLFLFANQ
jgi:hypothetical protein